jgi:RNA polymerase sigma-70 factor (ECF subfamily)
MIDWDGILARDGSAIWQTCWRILANRADAEECFQEAFVAAVELSRRETLLNPRGLLQRLATARSIDRLRSRRRRSLRVETVDDDRLDEQPNGIASPGVYAEASELGEALREALAELPAKQAEVFVLHAIEGWSYQEIASRLSLTIDNVGVLVHRGRAKLKLLLARFAGKEEPKSVVGAAKG